MNDNIVTTGFFKEFFRTFGCFLFADLVGSKNDPFYLLYPVGFEYFLQRSAGADFNIFSMGSDA